MDEMNPATTYNIDDFIDAKVIDDLTFYNFSILEMFQDVEHLDHNLIEDYLDLLPTEQLTLTNAELNRYRYKPDILSYDIYGSTQLDFVILLVNDMIDPKEFDRKKIRLPFASKLSEFLETVYRSNYEYIEQNRE